jgi:glutamate 5-kinase
MRDKIRTAHRVVVKLGSNLFFDEKGGLALGRISALVEDLADARIGGRQVLVVSSGAVALGANALHRKAQSAMLVQKQAFAAVGQSRLINLYEEGFSTHGLVAAQVLLTSQDFSDNNRFLNVRNTLTALLDMEVIPVINENDTVATEELEGTGNNPTFSDNDQLSALVMSRLEANLLVILTDVDGLLNGDPGADPAAALIPEVHEITPRIEALAAARISARGRGGMSTKIQAAGTAMQSGGMAIIANGTKPGVLRRILDGEPEGTLFAPKS